MPTRLENNPTATTFLEHFLEARKQSARQAELQQGQRNRESELRLQSQLKSEEEALERQRQAAALSAWVAADPTGARARALGVEFSPAQAEGIDQPSAPAKMGQVTPDQAPTFKGFAEKQAQGELETVTTSPGQRVSRKLTGEPVVEHPYPDLGGTTSVPDKPWEYSRTLTTDSKGMQRVVYKQHSEPLLAHIRSLVAQGVDPHSTEFQDSVRRMSPTMDVMGVGPTSRSDAAMPPRLQNTEPVPGGAPGETRPKPMAAQDRTVGAEVTMQLTGIARAREASGRLAQYITDPSVMPYMGPIHQYHSDIRRKVVEAQRLGVPIPKEWFGELPPEVVTKVEQDVASLKNYTIRLITGAQMNINEEQRITGEVPHMGLHPRDFAIRLQQTNANNLQMEKRIISLALTGNQQARLAAQELGIPLPQTPAGVSGQPSGSAPQPPVPQTKPASPSSGAKVPHYKSVDDWKRTRGAKP